MIIVFDLDDTLYNEIEFVKSGLWVVSKYLDKTNPHSTFMLLFELFQKNGSGKVFNDYLNITNSNKSLNKCIELYRNHKPHISLNHNIKNLLKGIKKKYSLGLLTDGNSITQKNKFNALKLSQYFEFVVFSNDMNLQKPAKTLYDLFENHFSRHKTFFYIADNPKKDFITPNKMNWITIRYKNPLGIYQNYKSDAKYEINDLWNCFKIIENLDKRI